MRAKNGVKICSLCKQEKLATKEFFDTDNARVDLLSPWCKTCRYEKGKEKYWRKKREENRRCEVCGKLISPIFSVSPKVLKKEKRLHCQKCAVKQKSRREKISKAHSGNGNPMWKGDEVGYTALHNWVRRRLKKPDLCPYCEEVPPYDLANISGEYRRDLSDWRWLCRRCHMAEDGRLAKLPAVKTLKPVKCKRCGEIFQPPNSKRKFCSMTCAIKERRGKFSKEEALKIRKLKKSHTFSELAKMYGVDSSTIQRVVYNKTACYAILDAELGGIGIPKLEDK